MPSVGFSTAAGRPTPVSEEALRAAQRRFADLDTDEGVHVDFTWSEIYSLLAVPLTLSTPKRERLDTSSGAMPSVGFSTAAGRPTPVNEEALRAAQRRFADLDTDEGVHAEPAYLRTSLLLLQYCYLPRHRK